MNDWKVEVFFDGDCPLCMREIRMLRRLDRERGRIRFTDITSADFDPSEHGQDYATFMARIQGRTSDGRWIEGVDVFTELYGAVGFGALVELARLPGVRPVLDLAYRAFAKNRLRLTGRSASEACDAGVCERPAGAAATPPIGRPWTRSARA